jgi:hypothetical protein
MTERKLTKPYFALLYCGLMVVMIGVWLVLFQNAVDLRQFKYAGILGDILLVAGIVACVICGVLIEREVESARKQATE